MAGRPSKATLAQITERLDALEKNGKVPEIKSTWSADLEERVARLEARVEKMVGFLKQMHSM